MILHLFSFSLIRSKPKHRIYSDILFGVCSESSYQPISRRPKKYRCQIHLTLQFAEKVKIFTVATSKIYKNGSSSQGTAIKQKLRVFSLYFEVLQYNFINIYFIK